MSNPKSKILPSVSAVFTVVFLFYCIDIFYPSFMWDLKTFGTNIVGCLACLITALVMCVSKKKSIFEIGFSPMPGDFLKGIFSGLVLGVLPVILVSVGQWLLYSVTGAESLRLFFVPPNSEGSPTLMNVLMFALACAFSAFSQEILYRGYIVRSMRPVYPFEDANIVQASFSVAIPLLRIIRNLFSGYYDFSSVSRKIIFIIAVVLFYIVYTFVCSIKRGLLSRVQGNIWPSVFENFFSTFLCMSLFVGDGVLTSYASMVKLLAVEIISVLFTVFHYRKQYARNKKNREKIKERFLRQRDEFLKQEQLREKDPALMDITEKSIQEIVDDYNKQLISNMGNRKKKNEDKE